MNDQMQQMVQQDIQDAETKPKEKIFQEQMEGLKTAGTFGAESTPFLGEIIAAKRTGDAIQEKDYIGAAVEAAAGVLGIVPVVGDAAGRALRSATRSLRKDAKLTVDNPGFDEVYQETYAQTKQRASDRVKKEAIDAGQTDTYEARIGTAGGITGYANKIKFKPQELKDLPGAMGEEKFRSTGETIIDGKKTYNKLKGLKESIAKEGYNPKGSIMIHVREDGQPFIVEGNHRLAEALESGRETIDADIRYLRGAEEKAGPLDPRFIFPDKRAPLPKYNLKDSDSRVFHLTSKDYDAANVVGKGPDDIGFHVGTAQQASGRGTEAVGERVLPMVLKAKLKSARIPDLGSFREPKNWLANLSVDKNDKQIMKFLKGDPEDAELLKKAPTVETDGTTYIMSPAVMREGVDPDLWKDLILEASRAKRIGLNTLTKQEDRLQWFSTIKGVANKHGYDSYVYKNDYEGNKYITEPQDSYMLLEADQAKGIFGGLTEGEPEFMKNRGGVISMKNMSKQMEMFEPVERGFDRGGMGLRTVETGEVFDFNAIADDYNQSIGKDIMTGQEMMALFDAFLDMKTAAKTSGMNEGGLAEEGGSVDPISGNSVPPGSTKEEVRDDIPAQLSEGEFVFPADVVRYIGLEKLMMMRQEAKMGLAQMEAMGQMGNGDEATMPDNLPFAMYDLEIEDDGLEMNTGGAVPPTGTMNPQTNQFQPMGTSPVTPLGTAASPIQAASANVSTVDPNLAGTSFQPVTMPSITMPFQQAIGSGVRGVDYTVVSYTDKDGNPVTLHKRKDGTIVDPATNAPVDTEAMGYTLTSDVVEETAAPKAQVQTARLLSEEGAEDKKDVNQETQIRIGGRFADPSKVDIYGNKEKPGTIVGGKMAGFTVLDIPGQTGIPSFDTLTTSLKYGFGKPYPDNATLGIVTDNIITPISGANYSKFKEGNYMDKAVVERTERNVAIAGQIRSKYGQPFATSGGARTVDTIARNAAKSDKAIKELVDEYGIDYDDIANNVFGGKKYNDAIKQAKEVINSRSQYITEDGRTVKDFYGKELTNDDIKTAHADYVVRQAKGEETHSMHNSIVNTQAAAKRERDRDAGVGGFGIGPGGPGDTGPGGTGKDAGVDPDTGFSTGYSGDDDYE